MSELRYEQIEFIPQCDRDADRLVLAQLEKHGADLSIPTHTLFYSYFGKRHQAEAAAAAIEQKGYSVSVGPTYASLWKRLLRRPDWHCIAEREMDLSESNVFAASDFFASIASNYGGVYDGWEAAVRRSENAQ